MFLTPKYRSGFCICMSVVNKISGHFRSLIFNQKKIRLLKYPKNKECQYKECGLGKHRLSGVDPIFGLRKKGDIER